MTNNITWRKKTLYKSRGRACIFMEINKINLMENKVFIDIFVDVGVLRLGSDAAMNMVQRWIDKRTIYLPELNDFTIIFHTCNVMDVSKYNLPVLY